MRVYTICLLAVLCLTPGEAAAAQTYTGQPAGQEADFPDLELPPLDSVSQKPLVLTAKERAALQLQKAFRDRNVPPVLTDNGRVTYAYGLTMPSVVCAPFMVTDIELQAGEFVNDVILGDTARWKLTLARSGSPETSHLMVKPLDGGLETMAVVTTDRRVYHIQLRSQAKGHMTYVGFVYPEDAQNELQQQIAAQRRRETWETATVPAMGVQPVDLAGLAFNYELSGSASWKPVQVFNDGRQTFIRLSAAVNRSEMPVLLVRRDGGDVLVNYRVKNDTLVVDDIFNEAVLLAGVGGGQQKITIRRK